MFPDQIECCRAIASAMSRAVPEPWETVRAIAGLDEDSVDLLIEYRPRGRAEFTGNIPHIPMLARYFHELAPLVSSPDKGLFRRCVFTVQKDGRYNANYEYA